MSLVTMLRAVVLIYVCKAFWKTLKSTVAKHARETLMNAPHFLHILDLVQDEPLLPAQIHSDAEPGAVLVWRARPPLGAFKAAGVPPGHDLVSTTSRS